MQIIATARITQIVVFKLIPSPISHHVKKANEVIPIENPMNRPGQSKPL